MRLTSRIEVRVTCTLAIAIGIFTACWALVIVVFFWQYKWKTTYKAKHPFGHVDWNPGSVKLSHELSDLLC